MSRFSIFCLLLFISIPAFSQNKVIHENSSSETFKGSINGVAITIWLEKKEVVYCDLYDRFIEGWYYYDKYKIKIPLSGFTNGCDMKLFNFGINHNKISKKASQDVSDRTIDSIYENAGYKEELIFDRCLYSDSVVKRWGGTFKSKDKTLPITLNTNSLWIGKQDELFKLPNGKVIKLNSIFRGYGGNKFYSLTQDKNENRVIFYFESISNHNACGMCGATGDGKDGFSERGYRIIYFDKIWSIKETEEYYIESCLNFIYDTKTVKKDNALIEYIITPQNDGEAPYHLFINKTDSKIIKSE